MEIKVETKADGPFMVLPRVNNFVSHPLPNAAALLSRNTKMYVCCAVFVFGGLALASYGLHRQIQITPYDCYIIGSASITRCDPNATFAFGSTGRGVCYIRVVQVQTPSGMRTWREAHGALQLFRICPTAFRCFHLDCSNKANDADCPYYLAESNTDDCLVDDELIAQKVSWSVCIVILCGMAIGMAVAWWHGKTYATAIVGSFFVVTLLLLITVISDPHYVLFA